MALEKPLPHDLTALAAEALDLWQEHLAATSGDPKAKAELMKLLEPSRQMFADWVAMMQHGPHATGAAPKHASTPAAARTEAAGAAPYDGALRLAELTRRVAELEKRLVRLESGREARLRKLRALQPGPNPAFEDALTKEGIARARRFIAGVKAYQHHPAHRKQSEAPVIWHSGTTSLRDFNPAHPDLPVALVIPSLINRFDILDLDKNFSFLRALAEQGFRPIVVDWDIPGTEEKNFSVGDYVTKRLIPALVFLSQEERRKIHIIGYCMGGLLALALAALKPELTRTLTLMATPWDFHRPDPGIGPQFLALAEQMEPHLETLGELPVDFIQSLFALFQPMQVVTKFTEAALFDPAGPDARHFVLLEDWLNDGVPLTAPVARECFRDWYGENRTAKLEWRVGGHVIDPHALNLPAYILVPGKDRIVPPESALPLGKLIPRATLHQPMMGHIGLIASRNAPQQVWSALFKWLVGHK